MEKVYETECEVIKVEVYKNTDGSYIRKVILKDIRKNSSYPCEKKCENCIGTMSIKELGVQ